MLRNGSQGDEVKELQRALLRKGINPGPIDGVFGPKTEDAVKRFQERNGLDADGIAGPKTMAAFEAERGGIEKAAAEAPEAPAVPEGRSSPEDEGRLGAR
jgi:peptidoglycan hydrolase-like protein with peptidoglycan-binding domain